MNVNEMLNWRYAVKKYSSRKVADEDVQAITGAINLSASSAGMQPYRLIVVENQEVKARLGEGSFNQQIATASHLLVFAAFENITQEIIDEYMLRTATIRQIPVEAMADFKKSLEAHMLNKPAQDNFAWAARQAYIGLGTGLIAAAERQIDATPMEGFDAARFDEVLGLKEKGLKSVVIMSIGYRDAENDMFSQMKKVRLPLEEFVAETV